MLRDVRMVGALPTLQMWALVWARLVPGAEWLDRAERYM